MGTVFVLCNLHYTFHRPNCHFLPRVQLSSISLLIDLRATRVFTSLKSVKFQVDFEPAELLN